MLTTQHIGPALALAIAALMAAIVALPYFRRRLSAGIASFLAPALLASAVLAGAALSVYHNKTGESLVWLFGSEAVDFGLSEFGVVIALAISSVFLVILAARERSWGRWLCAVAAFAVFFIAGEELSWGQWIFHWSTPEPIAAVNLQQETNLHNLVDPRLYDRLYSAVGFGILAAAIGLYFFGGMMRAGPGFLPRMIALSSNWLRESAGGAVLTLSAAVLLQHELFEEYSEFVVALAAVMLLLTLVREAPRAAGEAHSNV